MARAECTLDPEGCDRAVKLVENSAARYIGAWNDTLGEVLDELQARIDPALTAPGNFAPSIEEIKLSLANFQTIKIAAIGDQEVREFRLEDTDEGFVLEQGAWHLLVDLFGDGIFHSPRVTEGSKTRELTDVLGFCSAGICVVEAKAMAVLTTDPHRTTERRAKNVKKQIDRGVDQVLGAIRNIAAGLTLTSQKGALISFPTDMSWLRHGIIMVSDLHPFVDWEDVAADLLSESIQANVALHVLDLHELRKLVSVSDSPVQFMVHLVHRFQTMARCKSAYIRTRFDGPPPP